MWNKRRHWGPRPMHSRQNRETFHKRFETEISRRRVDAWWFISLIMYDGAVSLHWVNEYAVTCCLLRIDWRTICWIAFSKFHDMKTCGSNIGIAVSCLRAGISTIHLSRLLDDQSSLVSMWPEGGQPLRDHLRLKSVTYSGRSVVLQSFYFSHSITRRWRPDWCTLA